ncbi:hypothetical protein [Microbacterium oleivorans]|uniref:Uncharacterized protein n=1 Tax=Microbacterium oleivorans TaxID=273677 RepID=A0A4R5YFQ9_9MICO|nr:hypothetical protein [Microbacterium oleivorans]TDL43823.1 hypothetical protein E2R54_11580 [Microbacterium oleivorans]
MNAIATPPALTAFAAWFTPDRRASIQAFLGTLAPFAILLGFGTDSVWQQALIITGAALQFLAGILSLVNVRDAQTAWVIVRAAVYGLAATASPALVLLGFYDEATNAIILTGVSLGLSALSSLLAILIGKQQQIDNAVRLAQAADGTWSVTDLSNREG